MLLLRLQGFDNGTTNTCSAAFSRSTDIPRSGGSGSYSGGGGGGGGGGGRKNKKRSKGRR
jgi:hypothetical protein